MVLYRDKTPHKLKGSMTGVVFLFVVDKDKTPHKLKGFFTEC